MVIPGHNLGNSQVSVNRTIGPTLVVIARQLLHLIIRWCQIGVEPSASSTESSTNNYMAENPEATFEE